MPGKWPEDLTSNETTGPSIAAVLLVICVFVHIVVFMYFYSSFSDNAKWLIITALFNDIFFICSDFVFVLKVPKHPSLTGYVSLTLVLCIFHYIGHFVWCNNRGYTHDILHAILLVAYAVKFYQLILLLKHFFVKLNLTMIVDFPHNIISVYPIPVHYFTHKVIIGYENLSLFVLVLVIEELEKRFLKCRSEVLADDDPNKEIYYNENMDITAIHIKTKEQLRKCGRELQKYKQDYNDLQEEFDQYKKNSENERKELEKELDELKKNLAKTKKAEPLECCVCRDQQPNVLLLPCKHLVLCKECVKVIKNTNNLCPVCRKTIKEHLNVFFS